MDLGITLDFGQEGDPLQQRFARLQPLIEAADRGGFAMLSTGEQHPTDGDYFHLPSPLVALAALAGRTTMRLGTGVVLLPAWHPLRLAHDAAVLDQLCGGRLVLGVAGGNPPTWARFGVSPDRLADRLDQTVRALKAAWCDETSAGDLVALDHAVRPLPQQAGGPPVIVGGLAGRAVRRAAALGDGWFGGTNYQLAQQIAPTVATYRAHCDQVGREAGTVMVNRIAVVVGSRTELAAAASAVLDLLRLYASFGSLRHPDGTPAAADELTLDSALVRDIALVGTLEEVTEQLEAYRQAGVTHIQLRVQPAGVSVEAAQQTIEALATGTTVDGVLEA